MIKAIAAVIVLTLIYFIFIQSDFPQYIEFQQKQFGPSNFQAANDSRSKMYRYNSVSKTNSDYILLLKPDADSGDSSEFLQLFSNSFTAQGFSFQRRADEMLGLRNDGVIYMTTSATANLLVILVVEKIDKPNSISDAKETFDSLDKITL